MNEMQIPRPEQVTAAPPPSRPADPLRRWTLVILVLCVLLFGWTLIADRLTPYTSDASVRTFVVRISPEVSGKVIEVAVRDNQIVRTGDLLFRIDPTPFRIAVERAEAKLARPGRPSGIHARGCGSNAQLVGHCGSDQARSWGAERCSGGLLARRTGPRSQSSREAMAGRRASIRSVRVPATGATYFAALVGMPSCETSEHSGPANEPRWCSTYPAECGEVERRLGRRRGRYGSHDRPAKDTPGQRRMVRAGAALPGATAFETAGSATRRALQCACQCHPLHR